MGWGGQQVWLERFLGSCLGAAGMWVLLRCVCNRGAASCLVCTPPPLSIQLPDPPVGTSAMSQTLVVSWGCAWGHAAALGALVAVAVLAAQGLVEVSQETLAWLPGQGVRLEARRRCKLAGNSRFVPLGQLDGATIHEVGAGAGGREGRGGRKEGMNAG